MNTILVKKIFHTLARKQQTLAVAESCTGGGLAHEITKYPGISSIFTGGIVCYANIVKEELLAVPASVLNQHGAVSEEIARLMAENVRHLLHATWSIAITGIAGPSGGTLAKPVGLVYVAIAGPREKTIVQECLFSNSSRIAHRKQTITSALTLLLEQL